MGNQKKAHGKDNWNWKMLERLGLDGTDADFDKSDCYDKSLGRDKHGRPMVTIPDRLMTNEAPRKVEQ